MKEVFVMTEQKVSLERSIELLTYELQCRKTRFGIAYEDSGIYRDPPCGGNTCKYCGIVERDDEEVQKMYRQVIELLRTIKEHECL